MTTIIQPLKYQRKPLSIEAIQFDGSLQNALCIVYWLNSCSPDVMYDVRITNDVRITRKEDSSFSLTLKCNEPTVYLNMAPGDYVIKNLAGTFFSCSSDEFLSLYEPLS